MPELTIDALLSSGMRMRIEMFVEFGADDTADRYAGQTDLIADLQAVGTSETGVKRIIVAAFRMLDFFPLRGKENGSGNQRQSDIQTDTQRLCLFLGIFFLHGYKLQSAISISAYINKVK